MALSSSSTETQAWNQYYDNVGGWRSSASKASNLIEAMEWLAAKHAAKSLSDQGTNIVMSKIWEDLYTELKNNVSASSDVRSSMFARIRVQNLGT